MLARYSVYHFLYWKRFGYSISWQLLHEVSNHHLRWSSESKIWCFILLILMISGDCKQGRIVVGYWLSWELCHRHKDPMNQFELPWAISLTIIMCLLGYAGDHGPQKRTTVSLIHDYSFSNPELISWTWIRDGGLGLPSGLYVLGQRTKTGIAMWCFKQWIAIWGDLDIL